MTADPAELIEAFANTRAALLRAAATVPAEQRTQPFVGHWNLMDLMAHVVGWDYTNVEAISEFRAGVLPAFYAHYEPTWATYNARLVETFGTDDWDEMVEKVALSQAAVLGVLGSLTAEEVTGGGVTWRGRPVSIATVIRAAVRDEAEHTEQITRFVGSLGGS